VSAAVAVFAYGSLVDPRSAAATLGGARAPIPARLSGWRRGFTQARDNLACEKTFALADGSLPAFVLGLNVHPSPGATVNGAVLTLGDEELARLDGRELRYDRVEVEVEPEDPASWSFPGPVFAYVAKREHLALAPPPGAVILRSYATAVERAFAALGDRHLAAYRASVEPLPAPVVEAELIHGRIPPGNPRAW
jgi:cation transport regulator ChaC